MDNKDRLKTLRHALNMSVNEMAFYLGLSGNNAASKVREMERGARDISGPMLLLIINLELAAGIGQTGKVIKHFFNKFIECKTRDNKPAIMHTLYPRFYLIMGDSESKDIIIWIDNPISNEKELINDALSSMKGS